MVRELVVEGYSFLVASAWIWRMVDHLYCQVARLVLLPAVIFLFYHQVLRIVAWKFDLQMANTLLVIYQFEVATLLQELPVAYNYHPVIA
jgi:prepilin signal peptidase PulO-like enzyme (type II secretory pathway)